MVGRDRCESHGRQAGLVAFHAHPDNEALVTGGTLARVAAEGHRVVLAAATDGEAGAASALGCARVVRFGLPDSGWNRTERPASGTFSQLAVADAAAPLIELLREEQADALTIYDPAGGYGHPDHQQIHAPGVQAARAAGTRLVLEATIDRKAIQRLVRVVEAIPGVLPDVHASDYAAAYSPPEAITHRIDVRPYADAKRRAFAAHASQATADQGARTLALLLKLPPWLFRRALGQEWFVEHGRRPDRPLDDVFATLR
ncbi:PIG-L family deacetylase [Kribbella sp. NPDC051770]|uniref:PIG-L deacetylase family protein n=1 Tax=Kribbella sp. NPDC051770 TaxID=3155413 RepID=UPI0034395892